MKQSESLQVVGRLVTAFGAALSKMPQSQQDATQVMYAERIVKFDFDHAWEAVTRLMDTSVFMPSIAELRDMTETVARDKPKPIKAPLLPAAPEMTEADRRDGAALLRSITAKFGGTNRTARSQAQVDAQLEQERIDDC